MIFLRKSLLRIYKIEQMRVDKKCLFKNQFSWTWLILKDQAQNFIFQGFHILWQEKCNILLCQNKVPGNLKKRFFIFNCKTKIRRFFCICRNGCLFLWFPASEAEEIEILFGCRTRLETVETAQKEYVSHDGQQEREPHRTLAGLMRKFSPRAGWFWGRVGCVWEGATQVLRLRCPSRKLLALRYASNEATQGSRNFTCRSRLSHRTC